MYIELPSHYLLNNVWYLYIKKKVVAFSSCVCREKEKHSGGRERRKNSAAERCLRYSQKTAFFPLLQVCDHGPPFASTYYILYILY